MFNLLARKINQLKFTVRTIFMKNEAKESNINDNVSQYLNDYIEIQNPQFAVMLTGKWGSGKTFFIKKELKKWKTGYAEQDSENKDNIVLQPVYLSLYGLSSIKQLLQKLKEKISPFWHSKYMKIAKRVGLGLLKATAKIDLKTQEGDTSVNAELNLIDIFKNDDKSIKGNKIFVFDDLERSEIPLNQLFGFINEFVEHHKCKVILICDEIKLKEISDKNSDEGFKSLKYNDFKEKLIGQTLEINVDHEGAIDTFIKEKSVSYTDFFKENKSLILKIFLASKTRNLRILRQSFSDFERFFNPIYTKFKAHTRYKLIRKSVFVHFMIFYFERKSGNEYIVNWNNTFHQFTQRVKINLGTQSDEKSEKDNEFDKLESKYNKLLEFELGDSIYRLFDYDFFNDYLNKGVLNYEDIFEIIDKNQILKTKEKQDWEKLYGWRTIDNNKDFEKLKNKLLKIFEKQEIKDIGILTHLYYVFYNLKYANLLNQEKELDVIFINNLKKNLEGKNETVTNIETDYYGKGYQSVDITTEDKIKVNKTIDQAKNLIEKHNSKISKEIISKIVLNLNNDNFDDFKQNLYDSPYLSANPMWTYNIFEGVEINEFYEVFNSLELSKRVHFLYMLKNERYRGTQNYLKNEHTFLKKFKVKLEEETKKLESINRYQYQRFIRVLEDILDSKGNN